MKTKACVFWLVGLLLITVLVPSVMAQTPITGPIVITTPGDYELANDILNSAATKVIEIKCSDVNFNGKGFTIDGQGTAATYGIYIWSGSGITPRKNVTVRNVKVNEFAVGIFAKNISELIVSNSTIEQNVQYGINFRNISNSKFQNNILNNTANAMFYETVTVSWTMPSAPAPNIVGGPSVGGNYWGKPDKTGFSDTATDTNPQDGFADSPYTIATGKIDYLPLVKWSGAPPQPPITGDFYNRSYTPREGVSPHEIYLDSWTSEPAPTWFWEVYNKSNSILFTNGPSSSLPTSSFWLLLHQAGSYSVNLTISNSGGQSYKISKPDYITVYERPLAAIFNGYPQYGNTPLEVDFIDYSQGNPTNWQWDFGDGASSTDQNPVHTYTEPGEYTVALTVFKVVDGAPPVISHVSYTEMIIVNGELPVADFSIDQPSQELPSRVTFTDTSTGDIERVRWDFGDGRVEDRWYWWGGSQEQPDPSQMMVGHTYMQPGTYHVTLTVWTIWDDSSSISYDVVVTRPEYSKVFICCPDVTWIELGSEKPQLVQLFLALGTNDQPRGFSGYTVDLDIASESQSPPSRFTGVGFPQWAVINEISDPIPLDGPSSHITLKAADANNQVGPGQWMIQLAELAINAERVGSAGIMPTVRKLNDEEGGDLGADALSGEVHVYAYVSPFSGCDASPTDIDEDSLFEDINGNGARDYADVALYFQQMEQIKYFETQRYFDYNLNGRIDFNDVILLFQMQ